MVPHRRYALPYQEEDYKEEEQPHDPHRQLDGDQVLGGRPAPALVVALEELPVPWDEVAVAVDHLPPVVDRTAQARTLRVGNFEFKIVFLIIVFPLGKSIALLAWHT